MELLELAVLVLGPGSGVFVFAKLGMNGLRKQIDNIEDDISEAKQYGRETRDEVRGLRDDMTRVRERVSGLEAVVE